MSLMHMPFTIAGQWMTGLTVVAFVIATTGCDGFGVVGPGGEDNTDGIGNLYGVIVNTDSSKDLIGGVRLKSGEAVYAFGRLNPNGTVAEVSGATYQNASGQVARLTLESGRPVRAIGFDGATLEIAYTEVSAQRLKGTAAYLPAGGTVTNIPFDIDLQKTAAEVAALVEDLTGLQISQDPPPAEPEVSAAYATAEGGLMTRTTGGAVDVKSSGIAIVFVPVFIAMTGFSIVLAVSQIAKSFVAAGNAVVLAFLTPFILMGNLMRAALGQPLVTLQYDLLHPVINIPRPN